jgi:predicted nucleic acid-binding protein
MICVDANVAVAPFVPSPHSQEARNLLADCEASQLPVVAPPLLPIEVTNVIRRTMVKTGQSVRDAQDLLERFLVAPIVLVVPDGLYAEALALAYRYQLPEVYDAHYLAVAELYQCPLWTDDRRLLRSLGGKVERVHWIGDYAGNPIP